MTSFSSLRFNWLPAPSAYQQLQSWRNSQASFNSNFLGTMSSAASAFGSATTGTISGSANLAAQQALNRIQAASAKAAAANGTAQPSGLNANIAAGQAVLAALGSGSSSSGSGSGGSYTATSASSMLATPSVNILS